jgi:hypothetical protein
MMMTSPELLDSTFYIAKGDRPKGLMAKFIDTLPFGLKKDSEYEYYTEAYRESGYTTKIQYVVKNMWEKPANVDYYNARYQAKGKKVLSLDEYETALLCKKELVTNPCTKDYFVGKRKVYYQIPIYFSVSGLDLAAPLDGDFNRCKGMLDLLVIDHEEKTIQIADLKTIARSAFDFPSSFIKYGYYIQAWFYYHAVKELIAGRAVSPAFSSLLLENLRDYTVKPPLFIVVPKVEGSAVVFSMSDADMEKVWTGTPNFEGVKDLLSRWQFHNMTNQWEFPREVYMNNGTIPLKIE